MKILFYYIKQHKKLLIIALVLASINQCFSLCDSIITGKLINKFSAPHIEDSNSRYWFIGATFSEFTKNMLGVRCIQVMPVLKVIEGILIKF